jgi:amino acid transporter
VLLWISYVFALALYSRAFGGYAVTFLPENAASIWVNLFATGIVVVFTAINFIGARAVGRSEQYCEEYRVRYGRERYKCGARIRSHMCQIC